MSAVERFAALFLVGTLVLNAADDPKLTSGLRNGRFWNQIQAVTQDREVRKSIQGFFLIGELDGWDLRGNTEELIPGRVINATNHGGRLSYDELAEMVSAAYQSPENLNIPIGWVVLGCFAVQRGQTTMETLLLAFRQHLAEISDKTGVSMTEWSGLRPIDLAIQATKAAASAR